MQEAKQVNFHHKKPIGGARYRKRRMQPQHHNKLYGENMYGPEDQGAQMNFFLKAGGRIAHLLVLRLELQILAAGAYGLGRVVLGGG